MRRRWFGVFLMLFSSMSVLLFAAPALAAPSECHWVDRDNILCDGSAKYTKMTSGPFNGSFFLNGNVVSGGIAQFSNGNTQAVHTVTENNRAIRTNIALGNPENANAAPGSNTAPASINCDWKDKDTINCGGQVYRQANDSGRFILNTENQIVNISADKKSATKSTTFSNPTRSTTTPVVLGQEANATLTPAVDTTEPSKCDGGQEFTWIVCAVIMFFVGENGVVNAIRDHIIVPFLEVKPMTEDSPVYNIWSSFRNVASVFFILVFFLVILGTALGFDNYTIKKIMPHLVAGAILVPFSWHLCVFVVDIGNVLGQGLASLMDSIIGPVTIDIKEDWTNFFGLGAATVVGGFALYAGAAAMGLAGVISLVLALVGVFLTLIMRQILLTLFIVLSPFAILAWILPNTEKWFKTWWQNFFKLVMMYPIIMLLFEAGRLFASVAGATTTSGTGTQGIVDNVAPLIQILALTLPLFLVPFAFKFAGSGLSMANGAVGKFTGGLDKRYGKNSDGAKMAAKNREIKNMERGRIFQEKAGKSNGLSKLGNTMAKRAAYRRAGHAAPFSTKAKGFMSNPAKLIEHEEAYGSAMQMLGKAASTDEKKKQGLPGETAAARLTAETQAALNSKRDGQAERAGLVRQAQELGTAGLGAQNREIIEAGADQKRKALLEKGAQARGYNLASAAKPLNAADIMNRATKMAEASEMEARGTIKGELEMSLILDKKVMADSKSAGKPITLADAHRMRMENLHDAADTNSGNKLIGRDTDATTTNQYSAMATQAEMDRAKAAGKPISREQALNNRLGHYMAATVSKGVNSKLVGEAEDMAYNEVEQKAGGRLSGMQVMASARANARQGLAENRAKLETGVMRDKVTTGAMITTARNSAFKNLAGKQANVKAQVLDMVKEAATDGIPLAAPGGQLAANLAAADRTFKATTIGDSGNFATKSAHERAEIDVAAADARNSHLTPGTDQALLHSARVAGKAAYITKAKQLSEHVADEEAVIDADEQLHVSPETYMAAGRDEKARKLVEQSANIISANKQLETDIAAEYNTNGNNRTAAEDTVRGRRLGNVATTGLLKGETSAAANIKSESETADAARAAIYTEAASNSPLPVSPAALEQARTNIATTRGAVTGRAAGVKLTEDIQGDIGTAETLEENVQGILNDPANKSMTREVAEKQLQTKQFTDAGDTARDISARRMQTELGTKDGGSYGAELAIKNQMDADAKNPDLPPLPPDQARARAKSNILKVVNSEARDTAVESRISTTRKAKGAAENKEAAIQIQAERSAISAAVTDTRNAKRKQLEDANKFEELKQEKIASGIAPAEAEKAAHEDYEMIIDRAGEEREAAMRDQIKEGDLQIDYDRDVAEEELFTAAGDAAEEDAGVTEATTQGRRIAYSNAFRSDKRTPDKQRIEGTIRQSTDARAKEAAAAKVREDEKPRSFDKAFEANLNVQKQANTKARAEEAAKMKFDDLGADYQDELKKINNGTNPFGNLPLGEVEQNSAGNRGLVAVVKKAIQNNDWHIAQTALEHLSATNGGFNMAKELIQYTPVKDGGLGGSSTNQVDSSSKDADMLKYIWDQSIGVASKGNPDANKPILVAAKDWKAEKLASTNDKFMGRVLKFYRNETPEFEKTYNEAKERLDDVKRRNVPESSDEFKQAQGDFDDADGQLKIVKNGQADFNKAARALIEHPNLEFNADALRVLVTDMNNNPDKPIFVGDDAERLMRDLRATYEGKYQKRSQGGNIDDDRGTENPPVNPDNPTPAP